MKKKIVILGAGITGLTVAWKLSEKGHDVHVVEKQPFAGGVCATFKYENNLLDYGPHKIYTQIDKVKAEIKKLLGDELITVPKKSSLFLKGKILDYPLNIKDTILKLNPLIGINCFLSFVLGKIRSPFVKQDKTTYEGWLIDRFGKATYELCFRSLAQKIWGNPQKLSCRLAETRVAMPGFIQVLIRAIIGYRGKADISAENFYYPKYGIGTISDKISDKIVKNGGKIYTDTNTVSIITENKFVKNVVFKNKDKQLTNISTDMVISTIPLRSLFDIIQPAPGREIIELADGLTYNGVILIYLVINKPAIMDGNAWIFFPGEDFMFNRIYEQKIFSKDMIKGNGTVLCCDLTSNNEYRTMPDEALCKKAVGDLEKANFLKAEDVKKSFVKRLDNVYPVYSLKYNQKLEKVLDYLENIELILSVGRLGLFNYNNMDHCMDMGIKVADLIDEGFDKAKWQKIKDQANSYRIVD